MLRMAQIHVIRDKVLVEGLTVRRVAREMGFSRNTVSKYLTQPQPVRRLDLPPRDETCDTRVAPTGRRRGDLEMPRTLSYKVVLEPSKDGGYSVYVPSLPGCISEGDSYEQALGNIREAIRGWLEVAKEFGDAIPASDVLTETVEVSV